VLGLGFSRRSELLHFIVPSLPENSSMLTRCLFLLLGHGSLLLFPTSQFPRVLPFLFTPLRRSLLDVYPPPSPVLNRFPYAIRFSSRAVRFAALLMILVTLSTSNKAFSRDASWASFFLLFPAKKWVSLSQNRRSRVSPAAPPPSSPCRVP